MLLKKLTSVLGRAVTAAIFAGLVFWAGFTTWGEDPLPPPEPKKKAETPKPVEGKPAGVLAIHAAKGCDSEAASQTAQRIEVLLKENPTGLNPAEVLKTLQESGLPDGINIKVELDGGKGTGENMVGEAVSLKRALGEEGQEAFDFKGKGALSSILSCLAGALEKTIACDEALKEKPVTIDVKMAAFETILKNLADQAGATVEKDPDGTTRLKAPPSKDQRDELNLPERQEASGPFSRMKRGFSSVAGFPWPARLSAGR
jgi:hypothetical protein